MSKGLSGYYQLQIDQYSVKIHDKNENLKRLEAQRNDLNARGMFILSSSSEFPTPMSLIIRVLCRVLIKSRSLFID